MASGPEPPQTKPTNKHSLLRRVWYVFLGGVLLAALILSSGWLFNHRGDADFHQQLANFASVWLPFVLSVIVAFIPSHETQRRAHMIWRVCLVVAGAVTSVIMWYQQSLAIKTAHADQENLVMTAVEKANGHTDEQVKKVVEGQRTATEHSDQKIESVKSGFEKSLTGVTDLISTTTAGLHSEIAKINRPDPPERARLQFSLWGDGKATPPLTAYALKPDKDGVFSVDFNFTNISGTSASKIDFWVYVCDDCAYQTEPPEFDKPPGLEEHARHRVLPGFINPGASFQKTTILVKTAHPLPYFDVGFRYSCETCGPIGDFQTVRILVLPSP